MHRRGILPRLFIPLQPERRRNIGFPPRSLVPHWDYLAILAIRPVSDRFRQETRSCCTRMESSRSRIPRAKNSELPVCSRSLRTWSIASTIAAPALSWKWHDVSERNQDLLMMPVSWLCAIRTRSEKQMGPTQKAPDSSANVVSMHLGFSHWSLIPGVRDRSGHPSGFWYTAPAHLP